MEAYTPGELIESGILLENGETLTSGRIVEIAREAKQLWENKDYHGFRNLIHNHQLNEDDRWLLTHTVILERGATIFDLLSEIDDMYI